MEIPIQIWLVIGFITYYFVLQLYSDFVRGRMKTNSKNLTVEGLRSKYKVKIQTFRSKNALYGFAWFKTIWINEKLFKHEQALMYTFHHEYYHLKHHHKQWTLFMRFLLSLTPLTIYFVNWVIFVPILLSSALLIEHISSIFEKKANEYSRKMTMDVSN